MSILDKEFDGELLAQLNEKLAEAAKVMKEVNELRGKLGLDSLILTSWARDDLYRDIESQLDESEDEDIVQMNRREKSDLIYERIEQAQALYEQIKTDALEGQLNSAGWSTSSSYC